MQFKSTFSIQDKNSRDIDNEKDYPTLKDLIKSQGVSTDLADYWEKECDDIPHNTNCLTNDD